MGSRLISLSLLLVLLAPAPAAAAETPQASSSYLGFDRNEYPGDARLAQLRKTFYYTSYWLNTPPGARRNSWKGKRALLQQHGFGFLLLFNGLLFRDLENRDQAALGRTDGRAAVAAAVAEGFRRQSVIFLDQEEGGRLLEEQFAYIEAWIETVRAAHFVPGVYCSGILMQQDGETLSTASDLRAKLGKRDVRLWVANDQCPPAPGCTYPKTVPHPTQSGTAEAAVWQYAQSPRRTQFTAGCTQGYAADNMCYAPGLPQGADSFVDLNVSDSPDPSHTR